VVDRSLMHASGAAVPLYLQIHATLKERIVTGRYVVASVLPTESLLCAEFKASRYTIREALRVLSEEGFVHRRQRTGTVVLSRSPQATYTQSFRSIEDLFQIATQTHYVLLDTEKVVLDAEVAPRVGGAAGEEWYCVAGVRWDKPGGTPICYIHSYVPLRFAHVVDEFPTTRGPFYALLEQRCGEPIEEVVQEINSVPMPGEIIKALGLESGSLSLRLLRRYTTKSGTLIASYNWHRADQFTYRMQLHRRSEATRGLRVLGGGVR
jgi:GntR family transcriptional regulator